MADQGIPPAYLERIRRCLPDLVITEAEVNSEGLVNDIVVVNRTRVFRFAKGGPPSLQTLEKEIRVLRLVSQSVSLPVPVPDLEGPGMVSYPLIPGEALTRSDILRENEATQDGLAEQLALFLRQLHAIPHAACAENQIPASDAIASRADCLRVYEEAERELLPWAQTYVKRAVRELFRPLLDGSMDMAYAPSLIHGDLGLQHILYEPSAKRIMGIIDFGFAGVGDPAHDYGVVVGCYGESFLRRMARFTPEIRYIVDRARFIAGIAPVRWAIAAITQKNPYWNTPCLGMAFDSLPIGMPWRE